MIFKSTNTFLTDLVSCEFVYREILSLYLAIKTKWIDCKQSKFICVYINFLQELLPTSGEPLLVRSHVLKQTVPVVYPVDLRLDNDPDKPGNILLSVFKYKLRCYVYLLW